MRSFLFHTLMFLLLLALGTGAYVWMYVDYFPAPRLTRNISLNEQLQRVKKTLEGRDPYSPDGRVDVLAAGSSMSLNNLNSGVVVERFGKSYINIGSWSTQIDQTAMLLEVMLDKLKPHTLILTSNMEDWMANRRQYDLDKDQIEGYLTRWSTVGSYLRTMRPSFYLREMERNKIRMTDPTHFDFLGFDDWGWASINVPPERVEEDRNVYTIPTRDQIDHSLYPHLESMARSVADRGVRMLYIQSPYREQSTTPELQEILREHEARVRSIIEPAGHVFVTTTDTTWSDDLFIDPSHFRAEGSALFTRYALSRFPPGGHTGLAVDQAGLAGRDTTQ
jgi:hypothetical protein